MPFYQRILPFIVAVCVKIVKKTSHKNDGGRSDGMALRYVRI